MAAENILLMFDRPGEPIYVPKGDKKVVFDIPAEYMVNIFLLLTIKNNAFF